MTDKEKLEKLKKLADAMYYAAQYLTTDASRLRKTMEDYHQFIINEYHKEEPVNEDLEEAAINYMKTENPPIWGLHDGFIAGANWLLNKLTNKAINTIVVNDWTYGKDPDKARIPAIHERINGYDIGDKIKVIILKNE